MTDVLKELLVKREEDTFTDMLNRNNMLLDRMVFLEAMLQPSDNHLIDESRFKATQYYTTFNNVFMIAMILHERGQSFTLPTRTLRDLLDVQDKFNSEDDALAFIDACCLKSSRSKTGS